MVEAGNAVFHHFQCKKVKYITNYDTEGSRMWK